MVRRRKRKSNTVSILAAMAVFTTAAVLIGAIVHYTLKARSVEQIASDLCPESGETSRLVVLLDTSDGLAAITRKEVLERLTELPSETPVGGRLEISTLLTTSDSRNILFSGCNIGNAASVDATIANPRLAQKRWEEGYSRPLENLFANLPDIEADSSPIMAGIQNIALKYLVQKKASKVPTHIIVISDMIEHTSKYSQYRGSLSYRRYQKSQAHEHFETNLKNAKISIWLVVRETSRLDDRKHMEFWARWIEENNGHLGSIIKLQGSN